MDVDIFLGKIDAMVDPDAPSSRISSVIGKELGMSMEVPAFQSVILCIGSYLAMPCRQDYCSRENISRTC